MNGKTEISKFGPDKVNGANVKNGKPNIIFYIKKFIKSCLTFFTVEPYLLFFIIPSIFSTLTLFQFNMEKACRADLKYPEDICLKAISGNSDDNITTEALQNATIVVAHMTSWQAPLQTGLPAVLILFVGAWSDRTGNRKTLLLMPVIGEIVSLIGLLLGTYYFEEWPLWVMGLIEASSTIFTGGLTMAIMGSYSYIADVTTPETRTFRIGIVAVIVTLGVPLGTSIGGYLTEAVGYYGIYGISLVLFIIAFLHTYFRVHDVRRTEIEGTFWYKLWQFFHPINVWETISILFTSRGRQLIQIILVVCAHIVIMGPVVGLGSILYPYTLNKFNMDLVDFSLFNTYSILLGIAGTAIAITIFSKWLKFHDAVLGIIATFSKVVSYILYGLAPTRNWFFVGPVVDIFGNSGVTAIRSLGTKVVNENDVGKICSLIGFIDSINPVIYIPIFNQILAATVTSFPGAAYLIGSVITLPDFAIFVILYLFHKSKQRDTVKHPERKEIHAYENDVTAL